MKDIIPLLQSLGLLDSEIKIYLVALKQGSLTVLEFAKITKLSRQAVYVAIDNLVERGLMTSVLQGKKRFYSAEHPQKLLAYAKRRTSQMNEQVTDLERILPEIELQVGKDRPVVRLFEGKEGLKAIIEDMKVTNFKNSYEIADLEALYTVLTPEDLKGMRLELKKKGVRIKGFYTGKASEKIVDTERVFLPNEYSDFKANIGVYGNKIELITFEGKMYSIIIESRLLAETFRILFELAFKGSKEFSKE